MGLIGQLTGPRRGADNIGRQRLDRCNGVFELHTSLLSRLAGSPRRLGSGYGIAGHLFDRTSHLIHRRGGLFNLIVLPLQALGAVQHDSAHFFGRSRQHMGRIVDLPDDATQVGLHLAQRGQQLSGFVVAINMNFMGEVAFGNLIRNGDSATHGPHDAGGQQQRQRNGRDQRNQDHRGDHPLRVPINGRGRLDSMMGALLVKRPEFQQSLFELVAKLANPRVHRGSPVLARVGGKHALAILKRLGIVGVYIFDDTEHASLIRIGYVLLVTSHQLAELGHCCSDLLVALAKRFGVLEGQLPHGFDPHVSKIQRHIVSGRLAWHPIGVDLAAPGTYRGHLHQAEQPKRGQQHGYKRKEQQRAMGDFQFA